MTPNKDACFLCFKIATFVAYIFLLLACITGITLFSLEIETPNERTNSKLYPVH